MSEIKLLLPLLFLLLYCVPAVSQTQADASDMIQKATQDVQEMKEEGIPVSRVQNLLDEANRSYRAQKTLEERGEEYSYERVEELTSRIGEIREDAFRARDEIQALEEGINSTEGINTTKAERELQLAKNDYSNQRFSEAIEHVDKSYQKLSEAEALSTQVQAFLESNRQNVQSYIRKNSSRIAKAAVSLLLVLFLAYRESGSLKTYLKIQKLMHRKEVSLESLEELDEKYFIQNDVSKDVYELRREKFEKIRNEADSRIPELRSKLENSWTISSFLVLQWGMKRDEESERTQEIERRLSDIKEKEEGLQ